MDLLGKLPFLKKTEDESEEKTQEQAKADRIKFHRERVRNGPVKYNDPTTGQVRRARQRQQQAVSGRSRRMQILNHFETRRLAATVRGQLQASGTLPYKYGGVIHPVTQVKATVWLVQRFGVEAEDGSASLDRSDVENALTAALRFYGQVMNSPDLSLPDGFEPAIYAEVDA